MHSFPGHGERHKTLGFEGARYTFGSNTSDKRVPRATVCSVRGIFHVNSVPLSHAPQLGQRGPAVHGRKRWAWHISRRATRTQSGTTAFPSNAQRRRRARRLPSSCMRGGGSSVHEKCGRVSRTARSRRVITRGSSVRTARQNQRRRGCGAPRCSAPRTHHWSA